MSDLKRLPTLLERKSELDNPYPRSTSNSPNASNEIPRPSSEMSVLPRTIYTSPPWTKNHDPIRSPNKGLYFIVSIMIFVVVKKKPKTSFENVKAIVSYRININTGYFIQFGSSRAWSTE